MAKSAFELNGDMLLVAIVPTDLMFGMSRLWQVYADEPSQRTKVVRSQEEADAWLVGRI